MNGNLNRRHNDQLTVARKIFILSAEKTLSILFFKKLFKNSRNYFKNSVQMTYFHDGYSRNVFKNSVLTRRKWKIGIRKYFKVVLVKESSSKRNNLVANGSEQMS